MLVLVASTNATLIAPSIPNSSLAIAMFTSFVFAAMLSHPHTIPQLFLKALGRSATFRESYGDRGRWTLSSPAKNHRLRTVKSFTFSTGRPSKGRATAESQEQRLLRWVAGFLDPVPVCSTVISVDSKHAAYRPVGPRCTGKLLLELRVS